MDITLEITTDITQALGEFLQELIDFTITQQSRGEKSPFAQAIVNGFKQHPNDIPVKYHGMLKQLQNILESTDTRPAIKATTRKSDIVILERSKAGRKLQDKKELPALYDDGIIFPTYEYKTKSGVKTVNTIVSLSYEQAKEWEKYIPAFKRLKPFDLEILAHAATLYHAGNNIISTDMLFRQMNGGKTQQPTEAMRREIYDSFCRLGQTWIYINADEEYKAGLNKKAEFRGALLPCAMVIGDVILNGQPAHDCIKIYDISPLIEYAQFKRQVSNIPIGMFDISYEKSDGKKHSLPRTEENILLIGYLTRAIADMDNEKSNRDKHIISYEPIYDYLGVEGKSQQSIWNKKAKIRATVRAILDSWVEGGYIKSYQELTADNKPVRAGAKAAKIRIVFHTAKEKKISELTV